MLNMAGTTEVGRFPVLIGDPEAAVKVPSPLPSRIVSEFPNWFATARSIFVLFFASKVPVAMETGPAPVAGAGASGF